MPYIHFTEEQKRQANAADLVEFLRSKGEPLIRSGSEFRMSSNHSVTVGGSEWYDHAAAMNGKRVVIRTLDIGADKQVDYFQLQKEENPAMGVRAIRICLNRPEVFRTQLRALYRASAYGKVAYVSHDHFRLGGQGM